jgi:RHS repeat-associated protein
MGLWMGSLTANQGHLGQLDDVRVYNRALTSTEVGNLAGSADSFTTAYAYDLAGRVKTVTYPNGETVTQTYTGRGLPYQVTSSAEGTLVTSGAEYNALGQLTFYRLASGVAKSVSHWGIEHNSGSTTSYGRIYEIKFQYLSSTVHQQLQHSWDAGGNLTSRVDGVQSETESYTYDFLHRLTGVSNAYTESFSYNAIGNMTNKNGNAYTSGDTAHKHAVTSAAGTSYSYDANGSMTARGSQTLTWDVENRLASVSGGAAFGYDGDAVRVRRTEGGETVAYPNRFYEKNLSTSTVTKYYYLGGELINVRRGSTWESVHSDLLGGTTVSSNGATEKSRTRYYPFGATRSSTGTLETEKKFTGQRLDQSGLYFYNARYYDAGLGRFISADPKVQDWSVPQGLNRYSYVVNRPLVMVDPTGYDYVFVHGMDGRFSSFRTMIDALPPGEKACVFSWSTGTLYEATGDLASSWEEDQSWAKSLGPVPMKAAQLGEAISGLADVKLVGHSLGGNVVAQVLINAAEAGSHGNITAAVLIDAPLNSGLATGLSAAATGGFVQPSIAGDLGAIGTSPVPVINLISTDPWFSALNATLDGALNLTIPSGHSMTGNAQAIIIVAALSASSTGRLADTFWEYEWERLYG